MQRKIQKNAGIFYDVNNVDEVQINAEIGFLDFAK